MTDPAKGGKVMIEVTQDDLVKRIEYILDPSASATERMHRRVHLTNHDLRECIKALRDTARIEALEAEVARLQGERDTIVANRRINDAVQTALERGEITLDVEGYVVRRIGKDEQ